jgi:hypothetical protein
MAHEHSRHAALILLAPACAAIYESLAARHHAALYQGERYFGQKLARPLVLVKGSSLGSISLNVERFWHEGVSKQRRGH